MADVNRGSRPLSPHLQIYRPQITSVMSILHRITGVALTFGAVLVVWWFLAAASGPGYFAFVDGLLTSWIGTLIMIGSLWALCYHLCNGIRHLWWDTGRGFELDAVTRSGQIATGASVVLTLIVLILA
ncbi:succinate dehydrogenase, cytochrome b556 subunit [Limibaculum sp. M0105]|uniref:Succinate dehydrogenase cytochrome b556 subunit n=1 Tax=Thermohalobaculum xanthum TaxID=2753746 RepID=A0A8J7M9B4_9RHOB|nr:succinate dehydrogenase, cytochrome b556 subunit [Thermohalobaculum xanthum]MBK0400709.1 succinate dehydrogenase, cytochrome b556 subunit [Thermohalobaculum xanthum]